MMSEDIITLADNEYNIEKKKHKERIFILKKDYNYLQECYFQGFDSC
jgi:hypothetical protein